MSTVVKEVMIPISEYVTVKEDATMLDVFLALNDRKDAGEKFHRDVLVEGEDGEIVGKVTMMDIFMALEPNYKRMFENKSSDTLTGELVAKLYKEYGFWAEPLQSLCEKGVQYTVADIMHEPEEAEYVQADDPVGQAVHRYVIGVHQPLLVKNGEGLVGVVRFEELYEEVKTRMLSCGA